MGELGVARGAGESGSTSAVCLPQFQLPLQVDVCMDSARTGSGTAAVSPRVSAQLDRGHLNSQLKFSLKPMQAGRPTPLPGHQHRRRAARRQGSPCGGTPLQHPQVDPGVIRKPGASLKPFVRHVTPQQPVPAPAESGASPGRPASRSWSFDACLRAAQCGKTDSQPLHHLWQRPAGTSHFSMSR